METIKKNIHQITPDDLCLLLKKKFWVEKMDRFFKIDDSYQFSGQKLKLSNKNSILMKFESSPGDPTYNLLFISSLQNETDFDHKLQVDLQRVTEDNIDQIVIWTVHKICVETQQILKKLHVNLVYICKRKIKELDYVNSFFPIRADYNYVVVLNKLCDLLVQRMKKLFHLVLSEIAAPDYDKNYGKEKVGTNAIMNFEEEQLEKLAKSVVKRSNSKKNIETIAIDVGCGTGRHTIKTLSKIFTKVYAFDFSPKMIEQAKLTKRSNEINNVVFSVADLEYEDIIYESEFLGKANLIVASFGMGSFVEDTTKMLRRFYEWLAPGGKLFISFYNRESILLNITPNWRDTSIAAHIDINNKTLNVELNKNVTFQIFCKPFDKNVRSEIAKKYKIDKLSSYPTTMALLPNSLLTNQTARDIFSIVDDILSDGKKYLYGHYILLVAHKPDIICVNGYKNVINTIKQSDINKSDFLIQEHEMVLSIDDVKKEIGNYPGRMIKTIIFKNKTNNSFIVAVIPSEKRVDKKIISDELSVNAKKVKFATEMEINSLGFPIGGIPPFGFETDKKITYFIDADILKNEDGFLYMGVGDNTKTLKIKAQAFKKLVNNYQPLHF